MSPIVVNSVDNFGKRYEKIKDTLFDQQSWLHISLNAQHEIQIVNGV